MAVVVLKVCTLQEWAAARASGTYAGSQDDRRDGFIHLSTPAQLAETLLRHFKMRTGLCVVAFDADRLGEALRWESSRNGDLFPHVYGTLDPSTALWEAALPLRPDGTHVLPPEVGRHA